MARPASAPFLLVGYQRGVLRALRALGRSAVVLVPRDRELPAGKRIRGVRAVDMHGPLEPIVDAARELLGERPPAAVVALAERTVLVAGRLREVFGLPGNDATVALRCADKVEMKRAMNAGGVPVATWHEVRPGTTARELVAALGLPLVLKPRRDSGGRGQSKHEDEASVARALTAILRDDGFESGYGWLAEGWLSGVEMSVESLVHEGRACFHNPTEYYVPRHANILPAELEPELWSELQAFVERALALAGVERGLTHLELFRDGHHFVLGELAVRPPGGRLMTLLRRAWDFDPWEALLRLELGEEISPPTSPACTAGVWVLHPGSGRLTAIDGLAQVCEMPNVTRVALKIAPGDQIPERQGSGEDVGALYVEGPDRATVATTLSQARERLRFELG